MGILKETKTDVVVSYLPVGVTLHLGKSAEELQRTLDRAFTLGRHYFRLEGSLAHDVTLTGDARFVFEALLNQEAL